MGKNKIVHYVGFVTDLRIEEFTSLWESFMILPATASEKIILQESIPDDNGVFKYKYISRHESSISDFRFLFMKENNRSNFPERKARIVRAGGYLPVQFQPFPDTLGKQVKIIAFIPAGENELDVYRRQAVNRLNIYEAYFENCMYSYVLEFFLPEQDAPGLLAWLRCRPGIEAALYEECHIGSHSKITL